MTVRLLTFTTAIALSASLAYAGQIRQRAPGGSSSSSGGSQSGGSQSGGSQSGGSQSGGSQSGGSQGGGSQSRGSQSSGGQSSGAQSSGGGSSRESSGGSQVQRWGAPREAAPRQAAPPPAPRQDAPAPAPQQESRGSLVQRFNAARAGAAERQEAPAPVQQESRGSLLQRSRESAGAQQAPPPAPRSGSLIQRLGTTRHEEVVGEPEITERAPARPFFSENVTRAVPRQPETAPAASPIAAAATEPAARAATPQPGQRVAQGRQRVPGPQDQPQVYAVPRGSVSPAPRPGTIDSDRRIIARSTTRVYNNYYYYPRHNYPYGFGSYGLGYFYYDPYNWYDAYDVYPPSYSSGIYQYPYGYATGELRLQVRPRHAEVYVDGYYAGRVDEFDGFFQGLRIEEGPHVIEIVARGYQTLVFNVRIIAGRKLDYKANLLPY